MISTMFSCVAKMNTKASEFPTMYEEHPLSIIILPPMNESTAADAIQYYSTTIQEPLAYMGYYTFPYPITTEILRMEGIYDSEQLVNIPLIKFKEYFDADAVLFTTIKRWDLSYMVLASTLSVSIECTLKSTSTDRVLWAYTGTVVVDLSGGNTGAGVAGLIAKVIVAAINTATADYVTYARQANYKALYSMPYGRYHPQYNKDKNVEFIDLTPEEKAAE